MKRNNTRAFLMHGISCDTELILVRPQHNFQNVQRLAQELSFKKRDTKRFERVTKAILQEVSVGFVLIEVMVSSCVLVVLAVLSMSYAAHVYLQTCQMLQMGTRYVQMQVALDVLAGDITQAPARKTAWKVATATKQVWTTGKGDVGFENTDHGMVRSHGAFDGKKQAWIKRTKSFFPQGLSYRVEPVNQDQACIYLVSITMQCDQQRAATSVALRSGVCL